MNITAMWAALTGASAITCWVAAAQQRQPLFRVSKLATMVALIALAVHLGALDPAAPNRMGLALVVGLSLSLLGDAFLLSDAPWAFLGGLGSFLAGHIAFIIAFAMVGFAPGLALAGLVFAGVFALTAGRRIRRAAERSGGPSLGLAVTAYIVVMTLMALAAGGTGIALVVVGACLFVISDTVLGLDRFVGPRAQARVVVMVTYHLAQVLFVVGLLGS